MSTTQVSLKIINEFIINEFLHLFKKDKELYKLYLESCYKKSNRAKEMWFRELTFIVTKKVGRHILYERFYNNFYEKYPNYAIDETQYNDICYFISDCINNDDDHEYHEWIRDLEYQEWLDGEEHEEDDNDHLMYQYIDDYILEHVDNREYNTQFILLAYFNHYLPYKMNCIVFRVDNMIAKNIIKKKQIRDAKVATIVLNKIPNLNHDVISHISKYICRDIKI